MSGALKLRLKKEREQIRFFLYESYAIISHFNVLSTEKYPVLDNIVKNINDTSKGGKIISVFFDGKYVAIKLKLWA